MLKNPFIPIQEANTVIVDGRISEEVKTKLTNMGINLILTTKCHELSEAISYHPDLVIHPINHNTLLIAPNVYDYYEDRLYGKGIKIIKGEKKLASSYPEDIAYNVGRAGRFALHNIKYTDEKLKYYLKKENVELLNIKQGYSKCSMAIIDHKTIITADYPIYKRLIEKDIDALLVDPGYIDLKGHPFGFIGGATGNLSQDSILFSGRLEAHPDKNNILNFIKKYDKKVVWLSDENAKDVGTIISLYCQ